MVRTYKRKTMRQGGRTSALSQAAILVENGTSLRFAAICFAVCRMKLTRYMRRLANEKSVRRKTDTFPNGRKIFSDTQELHLVNHIIESAEIYYGHSVKEIRKIAFSYAKELGIATPASWYENQCAGPDWGTSLMKRQPSLSTRKPRPISVGRATMFSKPNAEIFSTILLDLITKHKFLPPNIWDVGDTCIPVSSSTEVGLNLDRKTETQINLCVAVNAVGYVTPPMIIFPCKKFEDHYISNGLPGCLSAANRIGHMTADEFYSFLQHFITHAKPSIDRKVLLLLSHTKSHFGVRHLNLAKANGIVMLSYPPHCCQRLQPLERTLFPPLKELISVLQTEWQKNSCNQNLTAYELSAIIREAIQQVMTTVNIMDAFKLTGIVPFSTHKFIVHLDDRVDIKDIATENNEEHVRQNSTCNSAKDCGTIPNISAALGLMPKVKMVKLPIKYPVLQTDNVET